MTEILIVPDNASSSYRECYYSNSIDSGRETNKMYTLHSNNGRILVWSILNFILRSIADFYIGFFIPFNTFYDSYHILSLSKVRSNVSYETYKASPNEILIDDSIPYKDKVLPSTNRESINGINQFYASQYITHSSTIHCIGNTPIQLSKGKKELQFTRVTQDKNAQQDKNSSRDSQKKTSTSLIRSIKGKKSQQTVNIQSMPNYGLRNLGSTCYLNYTLQCSSHTLRLTELCVSDEYRKYLNSSAFKLVELGNLTLSGAVAPYDLKRRMGIAVPMLVGYRQHDGAHEFITCIPFKNIPLNTSYETSKPETSKPISNECLFDYGIPSMYKDEVLLPTNNESINEINQPTIFKPINKISESFDPLSSQTSATVESNPIHGLVNLGNTCFMNSILQCLSHTLLLRQLYVSDQYKQYLNNRGEISSPFKRVMVKLWGANVPNSVSPKDLKRQVGITAPMFSGYNQHDAHEFMRFLLNELHEEINGASVAGRKSPADNETLGEACARHLTWEDSRISELFGGMLRSEVCCSVCSQKSIVYIPLLDIALPIPDMSNLRFGNYEPTVSLSDCLAMIRREETLDEEERPYCNKCMDLTRSTKQLFICNLPRYLTIQLKRFSYYPTRTKLTTPVKFNETWRLKDSSNKTHTYSLYGIACHSGGLYGGHYIAYCCYNGIWRCFNDSMVNIVSWDHVKRQEAYILFYRAAYD